MFRHIIRFADLASNLVHINWPTVAAIGWLALIGLTMAYAVMKRAE